MKRTSKALRFAVRVGEKVRAERQRRSLSQRELAKKLATDEPTISRIESGQRDLRVSGLYEIGAALGIPPRVLVDVPLNGNNE
jgi:transcriptional regulator with XRE-family HTH domain